jgi:hypothetical protein
VKVTVQAYSGYKADERPLRFSFGERWYEVQEITDRWYGPGYSYFRVKAEDGNLYVLRLDETAQEWSLAGYRRGPDPAISI